MNSVFYYIRLALIWLAFFAVAKIYFLVINGWNGWGTFVDMMQVWWHGLRLDFSVVGYFTAIPLLGHALQQFIPRRLPLLVQVYHGFVWIFTTLIVASDPFFYYYWGQKANLDFTQFLGQDNAGIASIEWTTFLYSVLFITVSFFIFWKWVLSWFKLPEKGNIIVIILLLACSVFFIRGGLGKVPINISSAYFSPNNIHNNAAVNGVWNFLATELEKDKHAPLRFFENQREAEQMISSFRSSPKQDYTDLLKPFTPKTNIICIVLESFSGKVVGSISGHKYASTPELDSIAISGITYSNAYASSFRSDKGLLAITTGIPSGARQTLTNFPDKLAKKPSIFNLFNSPYFSSFYYGGNMDFANIKVLFQEANAVKSEDDFNTSIKNTWGAHDEVVFKTFADDFIRRKQPQFSMLFSLSSHEPFDVPNFHRYEDPYRNSIAYTDSCLGVLIQRLKNSDKWDNTLIIITADHGVKRPDNAPIYSERNFIIPLVLTGGVVKKDTMISEIVSQADIPSTLANYINQPSVFLQNSILKPSNYAFYSYHNGLVSVTPEGIQYFDITQHKYLTGSVNPPIEKAYYQWMNAYFFNR